MHILIGGEKNQDGESAATYLRAVRRVRAWSSRIFGRGASSLDLVATDLTGLPAWRPVRRARVRAVEGAIGLPLPPVRASDAVWSRVLGAQVHLSIASEVTDVRVTATVDALSSSKLNEICLGDADASLDAVHDVLREFVSKAAGAFQRAAEEEGVSLTYGPPAELATRAVAPAKPSGRQQFVLAPKDDSIRVTFEVEILAREV